MSLEKPIQCLFAGLYVRIATLRDAKEEMPEDFINELYKWALESISMIALDTRLGCLEGNLHPDSEPQQMINNVQIMFESLFNLDLKVPYWKLMSTPAWRKFVKCSDYMIETSMKNVNKALERYKTKPADQDMSVLERILARDPNPKVACVMAIDMIAAGIDTTSNAVAFLLYHLATNPDKQKKVHEEIDRVLSDSIDKKITDNVLNELKYLKACSKESLRITPVALANRRSTGKDLVLQGYQIPKGTDVIFGHQMMSSMEEHYPQADQFIPERWLKSDDVAGEQKIHPFVTLPFGFGPRMCIGRRFAELEIEILVAKILQKYKLEWNYGPMETQTTVLYTCKSPLKFKMINRH